MRLLMLGLSFWIGLAAVAWLVLIALGWSLAVAAARADGDREAAELRRREHAPRPRALFGRPARDEVQEGTRLAGRFEPARRLVRARRR